MRDTDIRTDHAVALVVDDDMTLRFLARETLEQAGFRVEEAADGAQALSIVAAVHPDIVLLDINMPQVDGFTVCATLRAMPAGDRTPVLMMTNLDDLASINRAYEVGATDFITKPLSWTILTQRVRYMLRASQAYEALHRSETRLANAQRLARLGSWDLDLQTNTWHCTEATYHLFGLPPQSQVASCEAFLPATHPDDRAGVHSVRQEATAAHRPYSMDYRLLLPTGSECIVHEQAEVVCNALGRPIRMSVTVQDITEHKHLAEAMRTAKEAAEAAVEAKNTFLANMSHELRTPMNAIMGMTTLLLDTELTSEQRDYATTIDSSSEHLLTLISDLLQFSALEAGTLTPQCQPFELRACVEDALAGFVPQAQAQGLDLTYVMTASVPPIVVSDRTWLQQILDHLLSNAVKFTATGTVALSVDARPLEAPRFELHFAVQDTGIGMSPTQMERLFEPFTQGDGSSTRRYGGTGLGLAMSQRLIEMLQGRIWVESDMGQGSTIHFTMIAAVETCGESPQQDIVSAGLHSDFAPQPGASSTAVEPSSAIAALRTTLQRLEVEHGPALVAELVALFLDSTPSQLATLRQALAQGNRALLAQTMYCLQGSSRHLGARSMAALCTNLLQQGRAADVDTSETILAQLEAEFARIRRVLEPLCRDGEMPGHRHSAVNFPGTSETLHTLDDVALANK